MEQHHFPYAVCDRCHSRKVRCDRNDPCGNCQDHGTPCSRERNMRRLPKRNLRPEGTSRTSRTSRATSRRTTPVLQPSPEHGQDLVQRGVAERRGNTSLDMFNPGEIWSQYTLRGDFHTFSGWISLIPLTDAQLSVRSENTPLLGLAQSRRQALELALNAASHIPHTGAFQPSPRNSLVQDDIEKFPGAEFLTWMLNDIGGYKFGSFVSDYFRHISKSTLQRMAVSLLCGETSSSETILFTICVNGVAFKFLSTVCASQGQDQLSSLLWRKAQRYKRNAEKALESIENVTTPSLALLQAVLSGIFLHQGSGNTQLCYKLTGLACRLYNSLGLNAASLHAQNRSEEEIYCVMWCYMLDRNYAWKLGTARKLTDINHDNIFQCLLINSIPISEMILLYMNLTDVQDALFPFLGDPTSTESSEVSPLFDLVRQLTLGKMNGIRERIDQISLSSTQWRGLHAQNEIAALDFAYHSVMTTIFHLSQIHSDYRHDFQELYLQSVRLEISALVSICMSGDEPKTIAYLHWTLLYYPVTAYLALFCNSIMAPHLGDSTLLRLLANCLVHSGTISQPISTLQKLFERLVSLAQTVFDGDGLVAAEDTGNQISTIQPQLLGAEQYSQSVGSVNPRLLGREIAFQDTGDFACDLLLSPGFDFALAQAAETVSFGSVDQCSPGNN